MPLDLTCCLGHDTILTVSLPSPESSYTTSVHGSSQRGCMCIKQCDIIMMQLSMFPQQLHAMKRLRELHVLNLDDRGQQCSASSW